MKKGRISHWRVQKRVVVGLFVYVSSGQVAEACVGEPII
jgi:hypothetical protein